VTDPLFTDESKKNRDRAFLHNAPFSAPGPYQTSLTPDEESRFRTWVTQNRVEFDVNDPKEDYDMRGFWKGSGGAPTGAQPFYPDTYKTPYDSDFSNQSQYATPDNPFVWKDGATLIDKRDGSTVFYDPEHYSSQPPEYTAKDNPQYQPPMDKPDAAPSQRGEVQPSWYAPGADRSRTRPATPPTRIRPAADPTVPGIPGATSIPGPRAPDYPTPGRGVRPHYSPPGEGPQYPTPGIPGSHTQRPAMQTGNATRQDPVAGPAADHYERGFAEGRSAAPKFRENLLNLIDAHLMASLMEELGGHGIT
jgi:hypothetical protein